ncbi:hypothetical protein [Bradyrhizobium lablabi]|uniref:hypothetical protein n=1 Tax=Bradyrhizobium lablabi TaxID=722472 RepID=UPI001BA5BEDA|nr:hypothetical protein [Bradyrhizobium lablabi]MBR0692164.1 hypothetical protein [Bradyrhizobium lablabi]
MVSFPLLLIPLAVYNIIVFLMPGVSFTDALITLTLMSGAEWQVTLSDVLLAVGVLLLLLEVIKGARPGAKYLTDHLLALILFGAAAAEFVLWPKFGTSTYFLLVLFALVDFLSGIALHLRRRPLVAQVAPGASRGRRTKTPEPVLADDPRPASAASPDASVPAAASVAESVLQDQAEPKPAVASPDLQPGSHPSPDAPPR